MLYLFGSLLKIQNDFIFFGKFHHDNVHNLMLNIFLK